MDLSGGEAAVRTGRTARTAGSIVFVVAIVASGLAVASSTNGSSFYPKRWDPRIAPIASNVAELRGLAFTHYVPVRFLSATAFEKEVVGDSTSGDSELERETSVVRALGLAGGDFDLAKAVKQVAGSGTLAYYSPEREEIVVRGSNFDVSHQVTVAHELTHVLQDQHYDIKHLQKVADTSKTGSGAALRALIEGDAVRIEDKFVTGLPYDQQQQYDKERQAEGKRVERESKGASPLVEFLFGAPYTFGPPTANILVEDGGNRAIDDAFRGPIPGSSLFLQPGLLEADRAVATPTVPGKRIGEPETFGAFEVALMLGMQMDTERALHVADGVAAAKQSRTSPRARPVIAPTSLPGGQARAANSTVRSRIGILRCRSERRERWVPRKSSPPATPRSARSRPPRIALRRSPAGCRSGSSSR